METSVFLTGERIELRSLDSGDITDTYISWLNDPEVCLFNSHHVYPYTREKAEEYVKSVRSSSGDLVLAIIDKESKTHIGNISLQNVHSVNRSAEFAILLGDKSSWGKGIGKEAARLIINHGFKELGLHRIYCGTSEDNIAMQKMARSLGFTEEGRSRQAIFKSGSFRDVIQYGILDNEFKG